VKFRVSLSPKAGIYLAGLLFVWIAHSIVAQHPDVNFPRKPRDPAQDSLRQSMGMKLHHQGVFEGHVRNFFMSTVNRGEFPDYFALAMGGGLAYYSPVIKNFQVAMSGFMIRRVASSDLNPNPPFVNRYELGLFDVNDPDNRDDLDRLENLFLRYFFSQKTNSYFQFGKFHLKTPLVNLQDGRMRPNLMEGMWAEWNEFQKLKLSGGWLWRTSPRSTVRWFTIAEAMGVYAEGRATNGLPSQYGGSLRSDGVVVANATYLPVKGLEIQAWNYRITRVFNSSFLKTEYKKNYGGRQWMMGAQYLFQNSLFADTLALEKQYTPKSEKAHALSARIGTTRLATGATWNVNYTRITAHGRFLFPRELGIEPFYTFMARERVEGAGDVHAVMIQNQRPVGPGKALTMHAQAGVFWMPSVSNARLNKYTMPGFYHINLRARYKFSGFMDGLQADLLYSYKGNLDPNLEVTPANFHNKVDAHLLSVVLDYYF
jgi:hypothetical protein